MTAATLTVLCALKLFSDVHYFDQYHPDAALNAVIRSSETRNAYRRIDLTFEGIPGEPVPTLLCLPKEGAGPFPVLIFLHGIGQEKKFLDRIAEPFVQEGYAIASFDQLMQGERDVSSKGYLAQAIAFRNRPANTIIETRRLIDYFETRPDIDTSRVFLLGASYGAITGSTAAAFDTRIKGALLCYGGGDIPKLVNSEMVAEVVGPAMPLVQNLAQWLLAPADPVRYAYKISPRPVLFQAGKYDRLVPAASAQALISAARQPKDVIWYESDHIGMDEEHVVTVLSDALAWLKAHDRN